jgi:hypothetical protein
VASETEEDIAFLKVPVFNFIGINKLNEMIPKLLIILYDPKLF